PSHASLFTGTFPAFHKTDNKTTLNKNIPTAAEMFTDAGYVCGAFSTHLYVSEIFGLERGFQTLWCKQDARAMEVIEQAISWLNLHHGEPVFLFLHFFDPHWDYEPPKPYDKMFDPDYSGTITGVFQDHIRGLMSPESIPDPQDLNHLLALYDGEIRYCDMAIGNFINEVSGPGQDFVIVVNSDHGEEFRDHDSMGHGVTLYEEQLKVPLILYSHELAPMQIDLPVRTVDILPTLLDLVKLPKDAIPHGNGISLYPVIKKLSGFSIPPVLAETHLFGLSRFALRKGDDKLLLDKQTNTSHLFDLFNDPGEQNNISEDRTESVKTLSDELDNFLSLHSNLANQIDNGYNKSVELDKKQLELLEALGYIE
ncbi:sulfatase-like hydrolase/transferase, partial [bacterium]|nr:sulfatase-like hydrolase/transferase [bacterium]